MEGLCTGRTGHLGGVGLVQQHYANRLTADQLGQHSLFWRPCDDNSRE
jgi:hypothetical protein